MDLWTVARQSPLSMEFSRQEYWNGLPFPFTGDLPNLGIKPVSSASPALAGRFLTANVLPSNRDDDGGGGGGGGDMTVW